MTVGNGEDSNDRAFVRGRGEQSTFVVEHNARKRRLVRLNNIDRLFSDGVEEQEITRCGGDVSTIRRNVSRSAQRLLRQRIGDVTILRGR